MLLENPERKKIRLPFKLWDFLEGYNMFNACFSLDHDFLKTETVISL